MPIRKVFADSHIFLSKKHIFYSLNVLNFKEMPSVNTSLSVKYSKTLKHCHFVCMKVYSS